MTVCAPSVQTVPSSPDPVDQLFAPFVDSGNRIEVMLKLLLQERQKPHVFWQLFHQGWPSCDNTWYWRTWLLEILRDQHRRAPGHQFLEGEDQAFFAALPEEIQVYRGCSATRVRAVSWTTVPEVAAHFARGHRMIPVPFPVLASAVIPKAHVFGVSQERRESEIILDPRRLRRLTVTPCAT